VSCCDVWDENNLTAPSTLARQSMCVATTQQFLITVKIQKESEREIITHNNALYMKILMRHLH